jgi:hypothetical protein
MHEGSGGLLFIKSEISKNKKVCFLIGSFDKAKMCQNFRDRTPFHVKYSCRIEDYNYQLSNHVTLLNNSENEYSFMAKHEKFC